MGRQQQRRLHHISLIFIFTSATLLAPHVGYAAPAFSSTSSCSPTCRPSLDSSTLKYEEGKTYTYKFQTEVTTQLLRTSDETSKINITGQAILAAKSPCEFILTVQEAQILGTTRTITEGLSSLIGSSIRFSYQDGAIEGVCVNDGDPSWSANIKRSIVSMFQNRALNSFGESTVMEIDVSGRCPTTYTSNGPKYIKTRKLNSCTHRDGGFKILQGVPYHVSSEQNSIPLITSTHTCEQDITSGLIQSTLCTEVHNLVPVSYEQGSVQTNVMMKMSLLSTTNGISRIDTSIANIPSTLLYDHSKQDDTAETARLAQQSTTNLRANICAVIKDVVIPSNIPGLLRLVDDLRCPNNSTTAQTILMDTVAKAATTESISMLALLISEGKIDKKTQSTFYSYTPFASRPEISALAAFDNLVTKSDNYEVILAASGLAHRYCQATNPQCGRNRIYIQLASNIAQIASKSCEVEVDEKTIKLGFAALQSLGNLDSLPNSAVDAISKCLKSNDRMKITALEAFRRNSCQETLKRQAFDIFKDSTQTSEVRIQAYIAAVRCVQHDDVDEIQRALDNEKSNQVGSFMSSHIANVLASQSPMKRDIRAVFKQLRPRIEFPTDPRKFSTNFDFSTFSSVNNLGFSYENNLIFSQDSYIPRILTTNLEGQFFGRSYNFLEMGMYLDGFEQLVERILGPSGKFTKNSRQEFVDNAREKLNNFKSEFQSRFKRNVAATPVDINGIEAIREQTTNIKQRFGSSGLVDFYIRNMGTTFLSTSVTQDQFQKTFSTETFFSILDKFIEGAKDHNVQLTEPLTLLNEEYVIPTVSGLPLNIEVKGTTILSLQLQGKLDLPRLMRGNMPTNIRTRILPSAATTIIAKMSVGSGPIESGLQLEGKVHTASGIDFAITRQAGSFQLNVDLPEDYVQVVNIRSELLWIESENMVLRETPLISKFKANSGTEPICANSTALGLKLCAQIQIPQYSAPLAPAFPFAGDAILGFSIAKIEPSMIGYSLKVDTSSSSSSEKQISIAFSTPGSTINRDITAKGSYSIGPSPRVDLDIKTPTKNFKLEYQRWNEHLLQGIDLKIKSGSHEYSTSAKISMTESNPTGVTTYEPLFSIKSPAISINLIEGKVIQDYDKEINVDLRFGQDVMGPPTGKIFGIVKIARQSGQNVEYSLDSMKIDSSILGTFSLNGTASVEENKRGFNIDATYGKDIIHDISINGQLANVVPYTKQFELKATSVSRSFLNFDISYNSTTSTNGFENSLLVHRGIDDESMLTISQTSKYMIESTDVFDIKNLVEVTYPKKNIDLYFKADAKNGPNQSGDIQLRVGSNVSASVKYGSTGTEFTTRDIVALVKLAGQTVMFNETSRQIDATKWNHLTSFALLPEGQTPFKFESDMDLTLKHDPDESQGELNTRITISAYSEPFQLRSYVVSRNESYTAQLRFNKTSGDIVNLITEYEVAATSKPSKLTSKIFILNYLSGNIEETHERGLNNCNMEFTWIPTGRKIIASTSSKAQGKTYSLDVTTQWDATRDATQSASFKSATTYGRLGNGFTYNSENTLGIIGVERSLNFDGKLNGDFLNSENSANFNYKASNGGSYSIKTALANENKAKTKASMLDVTISLANQQPFQFLLNNRASNINFTNYVFELTSDMSYRGSQTLNLKTELHSLLTNKRTLTALLNLGGTSITKPLNLEFNSAIQGGHIRTAGSASLGEKLGNFEFDVKYDRLLPKKILDITYKIDTPTEALSNFENKLKLGYFFDSWENFEISQSGYILMNNANLINWDHAISHLKTNIDAKCDIVLRGVPVITFNVNGVVAPKKIAIKSNVLRGGKEIKVKLDIERNLPNLRLILGLTTPIIGYESINLTVRNIAGKSTGKNYATQVQLFTSSNRITLASKIDLNVDNKSVELSMSDPSGVRKVSLALKGLQTKNYSVDFLLLAGDKFISTKGNLIRTGSSIEGDLTLHSPALKVDHWNVKVVQTANVNGGNAITFVVQSSQNEQGALTIEYVTKLSTFISKIDGSVAIRVNAVDWGGTFEIEDKTYDKNYHKEIGRGFNAMIKVNSEKYPIKLLVFGKRTSLGNQFSTSFCTDEDRYCKTLELAHKLVNSVSNSGFEVSALIKSVSEKKTLTDQIEIKTLSTYNTARQAFVFSTHSVKLLTNNRENDEDDEPLTLGYKIFQNLDIEQPNTGVDLYLPQRKMGALFTKSTKQDDKYLYEVWLDKSKIDEKLTLSVVYDRKDLYTIALKYPTIVQKALSFHEMKMVSRIQTNENGYIIDTNTELDFVKGSRPLAIYLKVQKSPGQDSAVTYDIDTGLKGLIVMGAKSIVTLGVDELLTKSDFKYFDNQMQKTAFSVVLEYGFNHRTLELVGPDGTKIIMYSSRYRFNTLPGSHLSDGYDVRREIMIPGMTHSRIFRNTVRTSFPPSAHIKMYRSTNPAEFYEAWVGFKNNKEFSAGVYSYEGSNQLILADFKVALANPRLLSVKTTWNKTNAKNLMEEVKNQFYSTKIQYNRLEYNSRQFLKNEGNRVVSVVNEVIPNFKPALKYYSQELNELDNELANAEVINHYIRHYIDFFLNLIGTDIADFNRQVNEIKSIISTAANSVIKVFNELPNLIRRGIDGFPKILEALQEGVNIAMDSMVKGSKVITKGITNAFDSISSKNPFIANQLEQLSDTSKGIGKYLKESLIGAVEKVTKLWKTWKSTTAGNMIESDVIRDYVKYYTMKYERMIRQLINNYKRDFESFRESIMKALPDQETQEFLQSVMEYAEKKTRQESIDDTATQQDIYDKFVKLIKKMQSKIFNVDFKLGVISTQIPLPFPVKSLTEMDQAIVTALQSQKFEVPSYSLGIREIYNQLQASNTDKDTIPPFRATGLLIGSQYYKTFDNKFYHFEGRCDYILAADFTDGSNFTVVASYDKNSQSSSAVKKSIILTNLEDTVTILPDSTVLVNGKAANTPASAGVLKVEKLNNWITARGRGLSVACSSLQDVCVIKISGSYQGKTNGLLGTYNNENFDDMNSPSGKIMDSVETMAAGWKVGQCQENPLLLHTKSVDSVVQEKCANTFSGTHPNLGVCSETVSTTNYQSTCESLSKENGFDGNRAVCTSAFAYQAMCQLSGVTVEYPEECTTN